LTSLYPAFHADDYRKSSMTMYFSTRSISER